jgi:hypothetical protein
LVWLKILDAGRSCSLHPASMKVGFPLEKPVFFRRGL